MMWTIRDTADNVMEACDKAASLRQAGIKVRVRVHCSPVRDILQAKPAYNGPARAWRDEQAMRASDLADAKKYYKSPG